MTFHTEINISPSQVFIDHHQKILLIGSCFSDNIGQKLIYHKFEVIVNPFGTIYNIHSISKLIQRAINGEFFEKEEFLFNSLTETYYHFDLHSDFSSNNIDDILIESNDALECLSKQLLQLDKIVITLGTSYVFIHEKHGIVANCHKIPQKHFHKKLLSVEDQVSVFENLFSSIKIANIKVEYVLTVSPVRHIKEGLSNNNLSKSILRVTAQALVDKYDTVEYFPAYEIVIDDLRDYRFMKKDLIHPNEVAIEYIWDKFGDTYFDDKTRSLNGKIDSIQKDQDHRHRNPNSTIAIKHVENIKAKIKSLVKDDEIFKERFY